MGALTEYSNKIWELNKNFSNTRYQGMLEDVNVAYIKEDFIKLNELIDKFPSELELLDMLVERCKGKPVYANLKKIFNSENVSREDQEIALSSLFTRCCIESKYSAEFRIIKCMIFNRLARLEGACI